MPRFARAVSARHKAHAREPATTQANEEDRRPYRREKDLDKKRNKAKGKSNDTHGYTHALTNGTHRGDVSADYATLQRAHAETATCVACITFAECGNTPPPPCTDRNLAQFTSRAPPAISTSPPPFLSYTATVQHYVLVHVRTHIACLCMKDEAFKYVPYVRARVTRVSGDHQLTTGANENRKHIRVLHQREKFQKKYTR